MIPYILLVSVIKQQSTKINHTKVKNIGEYLVPFRFNRDKYCNCVVTMISYIQIDWLLHHRTHDKMVVVIGHLWNLVAIRDQNFCQCSMKRLDPRFLLAIVLRQLCSMNKCYLILCLTTLLCAQTLVLDFTLTIFHHHHHKMNKHGSLWVYFLSSGNIEIPSFEVCRDEIKKFFAIIVQMGMIRKRSIIEYWSTDPYLATPIFHSPFYLTRDRFLSILRYE